MARLALVEAEVGMIRPLRRRHRVMVIVLAVVLPALFAIAIATRKPVPVMLTLPELKP